LRGCDLKGSGYVSHRANTWVDECPEAYTVRGYGAPILNMR
jgi:hypothetical protein